jgi:hypothetical protein
MCAVISTGVTAKQVRSFLFISYSLMDPERRAMLVRRREVIKGELICTQTYIENHENKFHELKVSRQTFGQG